MGQTRQEHWTSVYVEKDPAAVSWYQSDPTPSLAALDRFGAQPASAFIDIGGGASNLVDALIGRGWRDLTVLDIAPSALEAAKARLRSEAASVRWEVADVTEWRPSRQYDVWHDRAVFHFLTDPEQRSAYREALSQGVTSGGLVIIATFSPSGPDRCSGLPVRQYDAKALAHELGTGFSLVGEWREGHRTPWGAVQDFQWCVFRKA
jgi:2-polyprenyl-3-methyl-5-hydroxy-6-metoxy-1,4-benzoquinol methylase